MKLLKQARKQEKGDLKKTQKQTISYDCVIILSVNLQFAHKMKKKTPSAVANYCVQFQAKLSRFVLKQRESVLQKMNHTFR